MEWLKQWLAVGYSLRYHLPFHQSILLLIVFFNCSATKYHCIIQPNNDETNIFYPNEARSNYIPLHPKGKEHNACFYKSNYKINYVSDTLQSMN